jgi:hypothetical protein
MKWNELVQQVLNERYYEYDGIKVGFRYEGKRYIAVGRVDYDTDETDWDNWNIEVWDIYERNEDGKQGIKIENPTVEIQELAHDALRDEANERGISNGHFNDEEEKPEREFNWEDLGESKNFEELKAPFNFRGVEYFAFGDVSVNLNEAEIKLYAILDKDNDELDNPLPEMIRDAQYALQDMVNKLSGR